jgi:hypothetical protein
MGSPTHTLIAPGTIDMEESVRTVVKEVLAFHVPSEPTYRL